MRLFDSFLFIRSFALQFRSPTEIRKVQEKKLRQIVAHAYQHVPYYKELFDRSGVEPSDIRTLDDLGRIPVTTKQQIQALSPEETLADNVSLATCRSFLTSGTSGLPLRFYMTQHDFTLRNFNCARGYIACGARPWHRIEVIAGDLKVNEQKGWYNRLGVWRRKEISSWLVPRAWIEETQRWKPHVLIGRVTTLRLLAEAIEAESIKDIRPRLVVSSAENLDDETRDYFTKIFNASVIDHYGCFESGCVAWECHTCSGYHVNADVLIVEILRDGKPAAPGEEGEVVITNLHSFAMPFIRYRQEDAAVWSARRSSCGRNLPLLERILGRVDDYLVLPDGRRIPPQPVYHVFIPVPGIKRWRVVQRDLRTIDILVQSQGGFDEKAQRILIREMRQLVGEQPSINVRIVEAIPVNPSEKYRPVRSEVGRTS